MNSEHCPLEVEITPTADFRYHLWFASVYSHVTPFLRMLGKEVNSLLRSPLGLSLRRPLTAFSSSSTFPWNLFYPGKDIAFRRKTSWKLQDVSDSKNMDYNQLASPLMDLKVKHSLLGKWTSWESLLGALNLSRLCKSIRAAHIKSWEGLERWLSG